MAYSEDHIALAAEYALGTLDAEERAQVESMMAVDTEYTALVRAWEYRVGSVEPRPIVWENIRSAIGHSTEPQAPLLLPEAPRPPIVPVMIEQAPAAPPDGNVIQLAGRVRRWRNLASAATAVAAALVAMLALQVYQPELLPEGIRPKPRTQVVEVRTPAPPPSGQYVAVLQKDAGSPAFILTVDAATRNFTVRRVGAQSEPRSEEHT